MTAAILKKRSGKGFRNVTWQVSSAAAAVVA
jgi:hypothetical protein